MARRYRESPAVGHATRPLIVREQDPIADHPGLGPMYKRRRTGAATKTRTRVKTVVVKTPPKVIERHIVQSAPVIIKTPPPPIQKAPKPSININVEVKDGKT